MDDGPRDWREARALLDAAVAATPLPAVLVATPHLRLSDAAARFAGLSAKIGEFVSFVESEAPAGLRVAVAAEIMLDGSPPSRFADPGFCFPGTGTMLVELPPGIPGFVAVHRVRSVVRAGFTPLLAHPERYGFCRGSFSALARMMDSGALLQVSSRSLVSRSESLRRRAMDLLGSGMCSVLASDCHAAGDPQLADSARELIPALGEGLWQSLTSGVPGAILEGRPPPPPSGFGEDP